jgi:hypothetical protein
LQQRAGAVHPGFSDHVVNERDVVHAGAERRDDLAELLAALAVGLEVPHRPEPGAEAVLKRLHLLAEIGGLAVAFDQLRFEIKQIDVTRRPGHEQLHDAFGLGWVMEHARGRAGKLREEVPAEQVGQGDSAKAAAKPPEKVTARDRCRRRSTMEGRVVFEHGRRGQSTKANSLRLKRRRQAFAQPNFAA